MVTTYKLNTSELESAFIDAIRATYPNQVVEIEVREQADSESDETEYLMSSPANRKRLDEAIKNVEAGKNLITFETMEQLEECVRKRDTEKGAALLQAAKERGACLRTAKLAAMN